MSIAQAYRTLSYHDRGLGDADLPRIWAEARQAGAQVLDLTKNRFSEVIVPDDLRELVMLDLGYNQTALRLEIGDLPQLRYVYAYESHLKAFAAGSLPELREISLAENELQRFEIDLRKLPKLGYLRLKDNPELSQQLEESIYAEKDNCFPDFQNYQAAIHRSESQPNHFAKVILIGNGRVGKTCLFNRLVNNRFDPNEKSTDGIQIARARLGEEKSDSFAYLRQLLTERGSSYAFLQKLQLSFWDFGGQDIYHATHRLFMRTKAVFVLVWDYDTEKDLLPKPDPDHPEFVYQPFSLRYWLSYAHELGERSPILIAQTKAGLHGKKNIQEVPRHQSFVLEDFPQVFYDDLHLDAAFDDWSLQVNRQRRKNGFLRLVDALQEALEEIPEIKQEISKSWVAVRDEILRRIEKGEKSLSLSAYASICEEEGVPTVSAAKPESLTLLELLHASGVVFYRKGLMQNKIILDQQWAIDAVYAVLNRQSNLYYKLSSHQGGKFRPSDLQPVWGAYEAQEQALFLDFMKSCKICFEKDGYFVAPALLPREQPEVVEDFLERKDLYHLRFRHSYLHAGILQSVLIEIGNSEDYERATMWQQGVYLKASREERAVLQAFPERHTLELAATEKALLNKFWNSINSEEAPDWDSISVSADGRHFVPLDVLQKCPAENAQVQAEDGTFVPKAKLNIFLNRETQVSFRPDTPTPRDLLNAGRIKETIEALEKLITDAEDSKTLTSLSARYHLLIKEKGTSDTRDYEKKMNQVIDELAGLLP